MTTPRQPRKKKPAVSIGAPDHTEPAWWSWCRQLRHRTWIDHYGGPSVYYKCLTCNREERVFES